ncbi:mitogen-activated protein kinase kinase kinase [Salvia divinorum]|uniref:Mitogen-activated protein kinase kinase kinase n=1 Tax=Salvia divinorum TaxID=28513 RepID=A0ABD1HFM4_SALDI
MAYDQHSIPKDLRPLNIMRTLPEDPRISPATSSGRPVEGYYASPPADGSPGSMPLVYYPATIPEVGFVPKAFSNAVTGVAGWIQQIMPPPQVQQGVVSATVVNSSSVYATSPNCSPLDHASDEGGDHDSLSGRKVKFLCSFGGKILPRLTDGALRYVGGQTRIISVARDVLFGDFVQKMADTYAHNMVIKYQLPDEDLDALVTVSCSDDLENMMDEYEKLIEACSDGSAKLRIFLFLPSDLDPIGHLQDGGQRYIEAVNGIGDVFNGRDCIDRKESIESTISVENSELSGGDNLSHGTGEAASGNVVPFDTAPRLVYGDPNPVPYADSYAATSISIPMAKTSVGVVSEQEVERSCVPLASAAVMSYPASSSYMQQAYADSHQETFSHANYGQFPHPQMGFPSQIIGTVMASPPQFTHAVRVKMNPSFIGIRPNSVPAVGQPQQVQMENYPCDNIMSHRLVQGYNVNRHQISHPEQIGFSEGGSTPQPERLTRIEDCQMCQKALPHAHSDTAVQERKGSPSSTISDISSISCNLPLDARTILHKPENPEPFKMTIPQGVVSGVQVPYGVFMANNHSSSHQPKHERPLNNDFVPIGMHLQGRQSPTEYSPKISIDDSTSSPYDYKTIADLRNEDSQDNKPYQIPTGEVVGKQTFSSTESYEVMSAPPYSLVGASHLSSDEMVGTRATEKEHSVNERHDNVLWSQPRIGSDRGVAHEGSFLSVSHGVGDILETLAPQFINQDPWIMRPDTHYPPPKPSKIQTKRDNNAGLRDPFGENSMFNSGETPTSNSRDLVSDDDGVYHLSNSHNWDLSPDHSLSNKGSSEEQIKRELEVVADGVATPVFHLSIHSNPDSLLVNPSSDSASVSHSHENCDGQPANVDTEQSDEIKTKLSEKINLGFPASGVGRLQIIMNSDLEELRELGSGTFGTVYHGKWRGTDVAIKRINDRCFSGKPLEQERMRDDFWNEAIKLADLHHPNVVAFYGVVLDGPDGSVATVTEYMVNGSLRNALQKNDRILDKRKRLLIGMDVAFGMEYLHAKNIVHFDLKSDNLLVNLRDPHRPICKVGDLGLSKVKCQTLISGGVRGTLPWMAPELLNGSSSLVSEKVDVFSFGIVLWELLTAEEPYADLHYGAIIGGIVSNTLRPIVPEACDPDWRALMERCWSSEPSERPNFTKIADDLRAMAIKLPSKGQLQHSHPKI